MWPLQSSAESYICSVIVIVVLGYVDISSDMSILNVVIVSICAEYPITSICPHQSKQEFYIEKSRSGQEWGHTPEQRVAASTL